MRKNKFLGFTLVELIVVISILAILSTIAFISYSGFSRDARDSTRLADMTNMGKSLELYYIQEGRYPDPEGGEEVVFSGSKVWTQGVFGEQTRQATSKKSIFSETPIDPLTGTKYAYSILNTKKEYQLGSILEGSLAYNNGSIANAGGDIAYAYIIGDYNGKIAKVSTGSTTYILAVPSIINGDMTVKDVIQILSQHKLVYRGFSNLPASYNGSNFNTLGSPDLNLVNTGAVVVYTGDVSSLSNTANLQTLGDNLQDAYNGTSITGAAGIEQILAVDTSNTTDLQNVIGAVVNNTLGSNIVTSTNSSSTPVDGVCGSDNGQDLSFTPTNLCSAGTASSVTDNGAGSTYTWICNGENGGTNASCSANHVSEYSGCSSAGQILTASSTYGSCSRADYIVCTGAGVGYTLSACNVGTNVSGTGASSYGDYILFGKSDNLCTFNGYGNLGDWKAPGGIDAGSANDWGVLNANGLTATYGNASSTDKNKMQGPCLAGYHVPTQKEWTDIKNTGAFNGSNIINKLNMPKAGRLNPDTCSVINVGTFGKYWSASPLNLTWSSSYPSGGYSLYFDDGSTNTIDETQRRYGTPIRCFKNYGTNLPSIDGVCGSDNGQDLSSTPTNLCSTGTASSVIDNGAGSTYTWICNGENGGTNASCSANHVSEYSGCSSAGQILTASSTYGSCSRADYIVCTGAGVGYTLSACNVGTNVSGTGSNSYGDQIQFGKSDNTCSFNSWDDLGDWKAPGGIDAGSANDWGVLNANGLTATYGNASSTDKNKMQGPCLAGYHVPTQKEWTDIKNTGAFNGNNMMNKLNMPKAGGGAGETCDRYGIESFGKYWTTSPKDNEGYAVWFDEWGTNVTSSTGRHRTNAVRCFKNY